MAMTFQDVTKMMLGSMDFFELRRTAARYGIPYQGVRRQKLVKDLERKIFSRGATASVGELFSTSQASKAPLEGAVSAKPKLEARDKGFGVARINTFSARSVVPRARA